MTLKNHITYRFNAAQQTLHKLHRFQNLNTNLQFQFFQVFSQSQLLFSPTALIYPKLGLKKAQILQNKAIRHIHKIHWTDYKRNKDLHTEYNIIPTTEKIYSRFCRVHYKLLGQNNHTLNTLLRQTNRDTRFTVLLANPPDCILDHLPSLATEWNRCPLIYDPHYNIHYITILKSR